MKGWSLKIKVTLVYTLFMTLLTCVSLGLLFSLSSQEILESVQKELEDRVYDSTEEISVKKEKLVPDRDFYNLEDGVYLSLYDMDGNFLFGRIPYGFQENGKLDLEEITKVLRFDLFELVLDDFGLNPAQGVFDWEMDEEQQISYAGKDGWSRVDARITTNGAQHSPDEFRVSYLQYGIPPDSTEEFKPVTLYGRLIGQYFEEWDTSIFFYILAPDLNVLDSCDRRILSASRLENS